MALLHTLPPSAASFFNHISLGLHLPNSVPAQRSRTKAVHTLVFIFVLYVVFVAIIIVLDEKKQTEQNPKFKIKDTTSNETSWTDHMSHQS